MELDFFAKKKTRKRRSSEEDTSLRGKNRSVVSESTRIPSHKAKTKLRDDKSQDGSEILAQKKPESALSISYINRILKNAREKEDGSPTFGIQSEIMRLNANSCECFETEDLKDALVHLKKAEKLVVGLIRDSGAAEPPAIFNRLLCLTVHNLSFYNYK